MCVCVVCVCVCVSPGVYRHLGPGPDVPEHLPHVGQRQRPPIYNKHYYIIINIKISLSDVPEHLPHVGQRQRPPAYRYHYKVTMPILYL